MWLNRELETQLVTAIEQAVFVPYCGLLTAAARPIKVEYEVREHKILMREEIENTLEATGRLKHELRT